MTTKGWEKKVLKRRGGFGDDDFEGAVFGGFLKSGRKPYREEFQQGKAEVISENDIIG